jgi:predicted O-methyltransferase YrrM
MPGFKALPISEAEFEVEWAARAYSGSTYQKLTRLMRSEELEIQDIEALTPRGSQIMAELHEANVQTRYYDLFCHHFSRFAKKQLADRAQFSVLEIGTGHGFVAINLAKRLSQEFPNAEFFGLDINSAFIKLAEENVAIEGCENVTFLEGDAIEFGRATDRTFDFAVMSIFIHHLKPYELYRLFSSISPLMKIGLFIIDVRRDFLNILTSRLLSTLNRRYTSDFKNDAIQSMRRAYTVDELSWLLGQVPGLSSVTVKPLAPVYLMAEAGTK